MRPTLFRLASDTEDNDEALGEHSVETFGPSAGAASASWLRTGQDRIRKDFVIVQRLPHSGDSAGQRQSDSRHQPVQAAGEGGDRERQQTKTVRWVSPHALAHGNWCL